MRFILLLLLLPTITPALAADISAKVRSTDGDSANINVRLQGIDAPELHQRCDPGCWPCGKEAAGHLKSLTKDRALMVRYHETDRYGRPVVSLFAGDQDIQLSMVTAGMATVYRQYVPEPLRDAYLAAEDGARKARRGIWRGAFVEPSKWRRGERLACEQ